MRERTHSNICCYVPKRAVSFTPTALRLEGFMEESKMELSRRFLKKPPTLKQQPFSLRGPSYVIDVHEVRNTTKHIREIIHDEWGSKTTQPRTRNHYWWLLLLSDEEDRGRIKEWKSGKEHARTQKTHRGGTNADTKSDWSFGGLRPEPGY